MTPAGSGYGVGEGEVRASLRTAGDAAGTLVEVVSVVGWSGGEPIAVFGDHAPERAPAAWRALPIWAFVEQYRPATRGDLAAAAAVRAAAPGSGPERKARKPWAGAVREPAQVLGWCSDVRAAFAGSATDLEAGAGWVGDPALLAVAQHAARLRAVAGVPWVRVAAGPWTALLVGDEQRAVAVIYRRASCSVIRSAWRLIRRMWGGPLPRG